MGSGLIEWACGPAWRDLFAPDPLCCTELLGAASFPSSSIGRQATLPLP